LEEVKIVFFAAARAFFKSTCKEKQCMARERIIAPNLKLQEERLRRAWSQQELADLLGTTHNNVSRWERGLTRPNLYFRLKLREVFALTESQLGLKAKETEVLSPSARAPQPIFDPLIPLPPAPGLVGRDELLNEIKKRILSPPALAVSALNGLPGAGKTALAAALAHDPQVISHFHGGVLWVGLGPQPDLLALYSRWGTLLGLNSEKLTTLEEWAVALRMAIGARPMFLLIDDAWRLEHALAVKLGGPQCAYLLTTRLTEVAIQFSLSTVTTVAELSEQQSFSLLSQLAPEVVRHDSEATRDLIDAVGGLPLALTLMGNYLRTQAYSGQLRRLLQAIEKLRDTEVRLSLNEPRAFLEQVQALPPGEPVSLQAVIAVSDQRLSEQARSALRAFSVFPPKPNSFTEEAALAVCALPVEVLDQLQDFGLLESNGSGRYTLHQTIADYARTRRAETASAVEERFVSYIARFTRAHKTVYLALEAERANIIAALEVAFMRKLPIQYVQIVLGFAHYLCVKGMYSTAEYHVKRALAFDEPDVATHSELLNFLGVIAKKYGRLAEAEGYHR